MDDAVLLVCRIVMGSDPVNGLDRASLVDRNVHDDRARAHRLHHLFGNQAGSAGAGNEDGPYDQIRLTHRVGDVVGTGHKRPQTPLEQIVQLTKPVRIDVDDGHFRSQSEGEPGCIRADDASADNRYLSRRYSGDAAQ
ncbi:hypothetical protein BG52_05940 [Paenibacillus darwinianus]|nr:hypothetical protein CH50_07590 [Paenibacillus darwinianus]EXX86656.1 hypothetical protein BG52_05940 [Paenibacillus darwinianus]